MDGVLVIDKPKGPTSHDVVDKVRRAFKISKVGHTGTLDPMASGVLPLVLGQGTKLARYLTGGDKSYLAVVRLGITTKTLDAEGEVVATKPVASVDEAQVEQVLATLRGPIAQMPPMYSAKKIDGKKLYQLARKGIDVEREAKDVVVHALVLEGIEGCDLTLRVTCSAGTYVRVLAQDIGEALGVGGHLLALRRTQAGPFGLDEAMTLDDAIAAPQKALAQVKPLGSALAGLSRIDLPKDIGRRVVRGYQLCVGDLRVVNTPSFGAEEALSLGIDGGQIIAVARAELGHDDLPLSRRDRRALKTERVLCAEL